MILVFPGTHEDRQGAGVVYGSLLNLLVATRPWQQLVVMVCVRLETAWQGV